MTIKELRSWCNKSRELRNGIFLMFLGHFEAISSKRSGSRRCW